MSNALDVAEVTVSALFTGETVLVLPEFQREYSWGTTQAEDLLEDVDAARLEADREENLPPYFLGTMLFARTGTEPVVFTGNAWQAGYEQVEIVDGQQRLMTLTILFAVLRDLEEDDGLRARLENHISIAGQAWSGAPAAGSGGGAGLAGLAGLGADVLRPRLTPRLADREFFAARVQQPRSTVAKTIVQSARPQRDAQVRIDEVRRCFINHLTQQRPADRKALAIFLLDRCRLIAMSTASLEYAYKIFLSLNSRGVLLTDDDIVIAEVIGPLQDEQKQRFQPVVDQMQRYREAEERKRLRSKTFFSHLVALHGWGSKSMISELRSAVVKAGGPMKFSQDVFQPFAEAYLLTRCEFEGHAPSPEIVERLQWLAVLEQVCDDEWVGAAMLGLRHIGLDNPRLVGFLDALERFAIAQLAIRPRRTDRRKRYHRATSAIREAPDDFDPVEVFALTANEQERVIRYLATKLSKTTSRTAKAVLLRIDARMSGRSAAWYVERFVNRDIQEAGVSLEHVLPRGESLPEDSVWAVDFPDDDERLALAECIGNLMLVSENLNRRVAQRDWSRKREAFLSDPDTNVFALTGAIRGVRVWDRATILARYHELMTQIIATWDFAGSIPDPLAQIEAK